MTMECEVIRDLLPLYADEACSEQSRKLVNEHLLDCADCRDMLQKIRENEIENGLKQEKDSVLQYGIRQFKKRTAAVGSAVSGAFLVPILICLFLFSSPLGWIDIVLASLCVAASVSVVPIMVESLMLRSTILPKNAAPMPRKKMPSEKANCTARSLSPMCRAISVEKLVNA